MIKRNRKPNAAQRKLQEDWDKLVKTHSRPLEKGSKKPVALPTSLLMRLENPPGRERQHLPSRVTAGGGTVKKASMQYTGSKMLGVSQMSKSNAIPVFNEESIVDIARMRR